MSNIEFKKSARKQSEVAIGCFVIVCIAGWRLAPINTVETAAYFTAIAILITSFSFWFIKKYCKIALCPHCNVNLFEVIIASDPKAIKFTHCPNCGGSIEI